MFICMQKMNSIPNFFFEILQRFANLLFWELWECFIMLINDNITLLENLVVKVLKSTFRPFWCLSACKKCLSVTSFLRYCKDIANVLFRELCKCLTILINIIVWICSKLPCLPACKKLTSSFTSFLIYYREIANFLFWLICVCLAIHI